MKKLLVLLVVMLLVSCSRRPASEQAAGALDPAFLNKLPANTLAFYTWDSSSPSYKRYRQSPWGRDPLQMIEKLQAQQPAMRSAEMDTLKEVLKVSGVVGADGQPAAVGRGVFFVAADKGEPAGGIYLMGTPSADMTQQLTKLREVLVKHEMEVQDLQVAGASGFTAAKPGAPLKLHLAAAKDKLAAASNQETLNAFFQGTSGGGFDALSRTPRYEKVMKDALGKDASFGIAYIDIEAIIQTAIQNNTADAKELKDLPLEAAAFTRQMGDSLHDEFVVAVNAKTEQQKAFIKSLKPAGTALALRSFPEDMVFMLNLDGAVLDRLKQAAQESGKAPGMDEQLKMLEGLGGLALGVRNPAPGSPYPEILLVAETKDAAALSGTIKQLIGGALGATMPGMEWQEKEIEGAKASYMFSPIGVALFLGDIKNAVVMSSSENIFRDAVTGKKPLLGAMPAPAVERIKSETPILTGYLAFDRLGVLLEGLQNAMAMFSGGKGNLDLSQIQEMKRLGRVGFTVNWGDQIIKVGTDYAATPQQG